MKGFFEHRREHIENARKGWLNRNTKQTHTILIFEPETGGNWTSRWLVEYKIGGLVYESAYADSRKEALAIKRKWMKHKPKGYSSAKLFKKVISEHGM